MDKQLLKDAMAPLTAGDTVTLTFFSRMPPTSRYDGVRKFAGQTVQASFVEHKRGRGKGGSRLMVLRLDDESTFVSGTPHSDVILNITTPEGGTVGLETEADIPATFETNASRAVELKETFKSLVGTSGATVSIESSEDDFSGTFEVVTAEQLRGRHGQVRLTLSQGDRSVQVWSYRHSGIISSFQVLSASGEDVAVDDTSTMPESTDSSDN